MEAEATIGYGGYYARVRLSNKHNLFHLDGEPVSAALLLLPTMNPPFPHLVLAPPLERLLNQNSVPETPIEIKPSVPASPCMPVWKGQIYTVMQIGHDFSCRRAALIRAITKGLESMCLYGHINGSWEVREPELLVPPRLPQPMRGFNLFRGNMKHVQWLQEIAKRCDSWLISLSFFFGANILNANGRLQLFYHINSLETVHEAFLQSDTYRRLHCKEKEVVITTQQQKRRAGPIEATNGSSTLWKALKLH
ncbi:hypothetical protein EJB05_35097, partial [Eragrostis curvula]